MVLSKLNGISDPLGLLAPFTVKGKVLMRKLWLAKCDWDISLTEEMRNEWAEFFQQMIEIAEIKFERCVRPSEAIDEPMLILFSDASEQAYGACAYVRWQLRNGLFDSCLLASKTRISPLKVETIVRLEVSAAIISKRL